MAEKEAKARIKINKLLEEADWRFEATPTQPANILLEPGIKYQTLGDDFENAQSRNKQRGAIDFLLLDKDKFPLVVVEAKKESINPLAAKEQARTYAKQVNARYIILTNGNIHYLWDTKQGSPELISRFPSQESLSEYVQYFPSPKELADALVDENYIISSQMPGFAKDPYFQDETKRGEYLRKNSLKQMRPYQVRAIQALQESARNGNNRFLFEMATGTGKTLISAAIIKLFLQTGNARRVLFLVDRLELETQAQKAFNEYLGHDFASMVYKENRESWRSAKIVVSTIQTFLSGDRYRREFSPTDFELVISDEAHRSIGGNSRVVFEYFMGYKLGLTATPKDYLKGFNDPGSNTQREFERRQLLDTYRTFGCDSGTPTFRYDLLSGVKDGYLINPIIVDARTDITTQLLSEDGLAVHHTTDDGQVIEFEATERAYEKKIYNDQTNVAMCQAFLDNGLRDPLAKELGTELFGKSIIFCVSQNHASKITQILNQLALQKWPEQYKQSDFAMQVTSLIPTAQQMTINFANNKLSGQVLEPLGYDSSKSRVCVTVGMMTTGYDCQDILNLALMRPVFSPSEFVQIKGRGTRKFLFSYINYETKEATTHPKENYKLFDFFATCEYFENDFDYDEKIKLAPTKDKHPPPPPPPPPTETDNTPHPAYEPINLATQDYLSLLKETKVGYEGLKIDREFFKQAVEEDVVSNQTLLGLWKNGDILSAEEFTRREIFDKPKNFLNLERIRKIFHLDRRISVKEFLEVAFGEKETFEPKEELLESEWNKFQELYHVDQEHYAYVKMFFKAYLTDEKVREIMNCKQTGRFNTESSFSFEEYQKLNGYKTIVPQYIQDYLSIDLFMN